MHDLEQRLASQPVDRLVQELVATTRKLEAVSEELRAADAERLALRRALEEKRDAARGAASRDQAILGSLNEGLVVFDLQGNVLEMNPAGLRLHGLESIDQVQKHLYEFTPGFEVSDLEGNALDLDDWPLGRVLRGETLAGLELRVRNVRGEQGV